MARPIRVLILEDNPADAELMLHQLRQADFAPEWQRVDTEADFLKALATRPEIILADYSLPQFDGLHALKVVRERALEIPVIMVTGALGDEKAAECIKQGATDYLLKDRLARLGPAVARALNQQQLRNEQRASDESLAYQAQLLAAARDAIIACDLQQLITAWNPSAEHLYGWRAQEVMGRNADELLHTEYLTLTRSDVIQRLLRDGHCHTEARQQRKDGQWISVEIQLALLRNSAGQVIGYLSANRDITDRKRLEKELAQYHAHLEELISERTKALAQAQEQLAVQQRAAAIGQIADSIARELRSPLLTIRDAIYGMKLMTIARMNERIKRQIAAVEDAIERCTHFLSSLVDYAESRPPQPARNNLVYLLTEAIDRSDLPLTIKRKLLLPDRLPPVYVDSEQIIRALCNVLRNARDAMSEGGTITISANAVGTTLELTITDNGPGIPPELLSRVFEPLFTTKPHGAGLGLAIARNFITANHGTISIQSEPGKGTKVLISLPVGL